MCIRRTRLLLSRVSILTRDIDKITKLSVRPSVRNVLVSDVLTYGHSFFSPYGSPIILVLSASNIFTKFRRGHDIQRLAFEFATRNGISGFSSSGHNAAGYVWFKLFMKRHPELRVRKPEYLSVTYNGGLDPLVANDFNFI